PHRALRRRGAAGAGGGPQHAGPAGALPRRPVLLEPALRHRLELRRPRRAVGLDGDRRPPRDPRIQGDLQGRRKSSGGPDGVPRPREPRGGSGDGTLRPPSLHFSTGLRTTAGVPSTASIGPTRKRFPSIARTTTGWSPSGFGRSGDRVAKTPAMGLRGSERGRTRSTSRRARSSQVTTRISSPTERP